MLKNNRNIVLILDNLRSTHNVGSLFRTAEGLGVAKIYLCGITPYPKLEEDSRLPHLISKITNQINKTALGAVELIDYDYCDEALQIVNKLKKENHLILSLEQTNHSQDITKFETTNPKIALIVGNEVNGINKNLLDLSDQILEIKMIGKKESFNVVQASAMALFHLSFF